jgi:flagellar hook protein FlgE
MTITSSFNSSVSGLNANAARLATISDNIANSSTYGYKRAEADFHSIVVGGEGGGVYAAGGVRTTTMRMVEERGPLIGTTNPTDISVDGRGFLPVTAIGAVNGSSGALPITLMTTGSFRADADGYLRTATGEVLTGWPADSSGAIAPTARNSTTGLVPVRIDSGGLVGNPTTEASLGVNLPATATQAGADGTPIDLSVEYYGNLGQPETLQITFTPTVPATGASNVWTMEISDSASGGAIVGTYTLTFDATQANGGRLASVTTIGGGTYDPVTGMIPLTLTGGALDLRIGAPGDSVMTQLAAGFSPTSISKNGTPVAAFDKVTIDENGRLFAVFDRGFSRQIYQIPVVDVRNPNGLIALPNQTYQLSPEAGPYFLWDAGDGPTGATVGFSREESTTDVAGELTSLIQTQRAYSSNAKVIQTVDEMLQETTNIKR